MNTEAALKRLIGLVLEGSWDAAREDAEKSKAVLDTRRKMKTKHTGLMEVRCSRASWAIGWVVVGKFRGGVRKFWHVQTADWYENYRHVSAYSSEDKARRTTATLRRYCR